MTIPESLNFFIIFSQCILGSVPKGLSISKKNQQ